MPDMYFDVDTAITECPVNLMPLVDDTDFKTIEGAVAYNAAGMALYWHFVTSAGAYTLTAVTPTTAGNYDWTDQGAAGIYTIEIPASGGASINNDTEGYGWFTGVATGVLPWRGPVIGFRAAALNDALCDGGDLLDVSVTQLVGDGQSATDLKDFADAGYDPATNKVQGVVLTDTVTTYTGNTPQTGDSFARLGAPAGASVSADLAAAKSDTAAILDDTGTAGVVVAAGSKTGYSLTATTGLGNQTADITGSLSGSVGSVTGAVGSVTGAVGSVTARVTANADQINGVATAAARLALSTQGIVFGTVGAASTTTNIVTSALDPAAAVIDQFKGRIVTFKQDTTTANLRGQSTDITANTALGELTVTALTTAPASGDTFTIT